MNILPENFKYNELSSIGNLRRDLKEFNTRHLTDLAFQESLKWKPGTYNKIKDAAVKRMFSHWFTKNGANTIEKLKRVNSYYFDSMFRKLEKIDSELKKLRSRGCTLSQDEEAAKNAFINGLNDAVNLNHPYIKVEVSENPYFNANDLKKSEKYRIGRLPLMDDQGKILGYRAGDDRIIENGSPLPTDWYANFTFILRNVELNVFHDKDAVTFPWGHIVVAFSVNLMDLFTLQGAKGNSYYNIPRGMLSTRAFAFPYLKRRKHPFISVQSNTYGTYGYQNPSLTDEHSYYTYNDGNMCLGDFAINIARTLGSLKVKNTLALLRMWAETFELGRTNPLVTIDNVIHSKKIDWPEEVNRFLTVDLLVCRSELDHNKEDYYNLECANCTLKDDCKTLDKAILPPDEYDKKHLKYIVTDEHLEEIRSLFAIYDESTIQYLESDFRKFGSQVMDGIPAIDRSFWLRQDFGYVHIKIWQIQKEENFIPLESIQEIMSGTSRPNPLLPTHYYQCFKWAETLYTYQVLQRVCNDFGIMKDSFNAAKDKYIIIAEDQDQDDPDYRYIVNSKVIDFCNSLRFSRGFTGLIPHYEQIFQNGEMLTRSKFNELFNPTDD